MTCTKLFDPPFCACMKKHGPPHVCTSPPPPLIFDRSLTNSGSSDLVLILGCMTSNLPKYLSFSTLYSSSLRRTHTIIFSKLNKPPSLLSPLSNGLEIPQILMAPQSHQLNEHFFSFDRWRLTHVFFFFFFLAKSKNTQFK